MRHPPPTRGVRAAPPTQHPTRHRPPPSLPRRRRHPGPAQRPAPRDTAHPAPPGPARAGATPHLATPTAYLAAVLLWSFARRLVLGPGRCRQAHGRRQPRHRRENRPPAPGHRITAVRELAARRGDLTHAPDAVTAAERADTAAWANAEKAGWTEADLRQVGFTAPPAAHPVDPANPPRADQRPTGAARAHPSRPNDEGRSRVSPGAQRSRGRRPSISRSIRRPA